MITESVIKWFSLRKVSYFLMNSFNQIKASTRSTQCHKAYCLNENRLQQIRVVNIFQSKIIFIVIIHLVFVYQPQFRSFYLRIRNKKLNKFYLGEINKFGQIERRSVVNLRHLSGENSVTRNRSQEATWTMYYFSDTSQIN